ncbi:MAG: Riboflavin transport system permease protein RibX [Chlamydiia bacterium]|nr:Riboflavin transport system permease protein RibX [Chlamydiia bacterium]MCH9615639.1 Riboflavin transport system permease protein RibX [Chlamydiia bacterium]MCH9628958.1 Riboflavin transport system permease protein RibX [Chlamydiia bacterium]
MPVIFEHTLATATEMLWGILLATLVAFPLGFAMQASKLVRRIFEPTFVLMQCIPIFALAPLMILLFGWGKMAIYVPTALMIVFPLTMNIYKGLDATPERYLELFTAYGRSGLRLFAEVRLPFALPHIFTGYRVAMAVSGVGAIAGEWAGAQVGLGVYMQECRRYLDIQGMILALLSLLCLSLSMYLLVIGVEKWWRLKRSF